MRKTGQIFVYLLECADRSVYIGNTQSLEQSLVRHYNGEVAETAGKMPLHIRTFIGFSCRYRARAFETFLKSPAGRFFIKNGWL